MRHLLPITLACIVVACRTTPQASPDSRRSVGTFSYRINFGARQPIEGTITIEPDTVTVDGELFCRRDMLLTGTQRSRSFTCNPPIGLNAFSLNIDAFQPALSTWSGSQTVTRTRRVCAQYTVTAQGRRVCARFETETYQADSSFGGLLRIIAPGKP